MSTRPKLIIVIIILALVQLACIGGGGNGNCITRADGAFICQSSDNSWHEEKPLEDKVKQAVNEIEGDPCLNDLANCAYDTTVTTLDSIPTVYDAPDMGKVLEEGETVIQQNPILNGGLQSVPPVDQAVQNVSVP